MLGRVLNSGTVWRLFISGWGIWVGYSAWETFGCDTMIRAGGSSGGGGSGVFYCVDEGAIGNLSPLVAGALLVVIAGVLLYAAWIHPIVLWLYGRIRSAPRP